MSSTTTGIGSGTGARASRATTARTRSTSADGRSASTIRCDPHRIVDAERPSAEVDRVRAVVARLARAPVPEPMPVVVDDIVAVGASGRRALPEVVVEPARDRRFLAAAYRAAVTRIPGAPIIHAPDCSAS